LPELTGDSADLPARQRTMRDAIAWSYELLSPAERVLFRRLAIFIGGFTLETAEAVIGAAEIDPFEGITALADSSLLRLQLSPHGEPRFGMLETVREYALEQLEAGDDATQIRDRHAAAQVELAERAEPHLIGPDRRHWHTVLSLEHDNIRAALTWLAQRGDGAALARLAGAMWRFWYAHGDHTEGRAWLRSALAAAADLPSTSRINVLTGAALLEHCGGNDEPAIARGEEGLALARQHGDDGAAAVALYVLGKAAADGGQYERADARFGEALTLFRARDDRIWAGLTLGQLGCAAYGRNDPEPARTLLEEALTLQRASGHRYGAAVSLLYLGHLAQSGGEIAAAAAHYGESLALWWEEDFQPGLVEALSGVATVAVARAQPTRAAKLFGAAAALREAIGMPAWLPERTLYDQAVARLRAALSESAVNAAWATGRTMPLQAAVTEALAGRAPASATASPSTLTARELDVLRLVSDGRSDKEIAALLSISPRTASKHVATILAKLEVENRAAAAVTALRDNLL
jgi:non-specific serine/threonine protein kinase